MQIRGQFEDSLLGTTNLEAEEKIGLRNTITLPIDMIPTREFEPTGARAQQRHWL